MYQNITASCYSGGDPRTFRRSGDDGRGVETIVGPRPHSRHQDFRMLDSCREGSSVQTSKENDLGLVFPVHASPRFQPVGS